MNYTVHELNLISWKEYYNNSWNYPGTSPQLLQKVGCKQNCIYQMIEWWKTCPTQNAGIKLDKVKIKNIIRAEIMNEEREKNGQLQYDERYQKVLRYLRREIYEQKSWLFYLAISISIIPLWKRHKETIYYV